MLAAIKAHPAITAFAVGTAALGTANAVAPEHDLVRAANTGTFLAGLGLGIFGGAAPVQAVGGALAGAAMIGHVIGMQSR